MRYWEWAYHFFLALPLFIFSFLLSLFLPCYNCFVLLTSLFLAFFCFVPLLAPLHLWAFILSFSMREHALDVSQAHMLITMLLPKFKKSPWIEEVYQLLTKHNNTYKTTCTNSKKCKNKYGSMEYGKLQKLWNKPYPTRLWMMNFLQLN